MKSMNTTEFVEVLDEIVGLPDADVRERMRANTIERARLDAEMATLVSITDQRSMWAKFDGHRSLNAYLRAELNCSTPEASKWRAMGRAVNSIDGMGVAWMAGRFGRAQAQQFANLRSNHRIRDQIAGVAPVLIENAEMLPYSDFVTLVDHFVEQADADGAHDARDEAIRHRNAHVNNVGGTLAVNASGGDPLQTAEVIAIFEKFCAAEFDADVEARAAKHRAEAPMYDLQRNSSQRRYDALVAVFQAATAAEGPGTASELVLNVVVDAHTFARIMHHAGLATSADIDGNPIDPFTGLARLGDLLSELAASPRALANRRCETDTGITVHAHDVLRAALSGHVRRVVVDANDVIINQGRKKRLYTGSARDAAKLLIRRCEHPGCELPTRFCDVDHADEWAADDGVTDQVNARIRCSPHNLDKTLLRWASKRALNGHAYTIREDGTITLPAGVRPPTFPNEDDDPVDDADDPAFVAEIDQRIRDRFNAMLAEQAAA
ncbi:MAG: hypothetical protein ACJAR2_002717 [Ilumatobacter sp.]|jgi:hypothetical protein